MGAKLPLSMQQALLRWAGLGQGSQGSVGRGLRAASGGWSQEQGFEGDVDLCGKGAFPRLEHGEMQRSCGREVSPGFGKEN